MKALVVLILILATFTGCAKNEKVFTEVNTPTSEKVSEYEEVSLNDVQAPGFEQIFASLAYDAVTYNVAWAIGEENVMWQESGYPGFGYPMIISINRELPTDSCLLSVQWGEYEYKVLSSGFAFKEDGNLINADTGKTIVSWGSKEEVLVLWNAETKQYCVLGFVDGTRIIVTDESN